MGPGGWGLQHRGGPAGSGAPGRCAGGAVSARRQGPGPSALAGGTGEPAPQRRGVGSAFFRGAAPGRGGHFRPFGLFQPTGSGPSAHRRDLNPRSIEGSRTPPLSRLLSSRPAAPAYALERPGAPLCRKRTYIGAGGPCKDSLPKSSHKFTEKKLRTRQSPQLCCLRRRSFTCSMKPAGAMTRSMGPKDSTRMRSSVSSALS